MEMAISVVMSVYNGEQYLREAIDSILGQTFEKFEFIIIDDGSTDTSKEIIKTYNDSRIVLIEQDNTGLATALNNGIRSARTNYIARMDADDISMAERLGKQVKFLNDNPDYVLVGTNAYIIDKDGEVVYNSSQPVSWEEIRHNFPRSSFFHSSVMFKRDAFQLAGGYFDEISKLYSFEDTILWNKMLRYGAMTNLPQPLIKYRLLPGAATAKSGKEAIAAEKILLEIISEDMLSEKNRLELIRIKSSINKDQRILNYHLHLAKKYIFNNYQPLKARKNLIEVIKRSPFNIISFLLFLLTIIPQEVTMILLKLKKHSLN